MVEIFELFAFVEHTLLYGGEQFMRNDFEIFFGTNEVGKMTVIVKGLYYILKGVLDLPYDSFWRVKAIVGGDELDLGICVKINSKFIIQKTIPQKFFKGAEWRFQVVDIQDKQKQTLSENIPVDDLELIENCYLLRSETEGLLIGYGDHRRNLVEG